MADNQDKSVPPLPYRQPFLMGNNLISSPWERWFRQVLSRIGGNNALSNKELEDVVKDIPNLESQVTGLENQVNALDSDVNALETEVNSLDSAVDAVAAGLSNKVEKSGDTMSGDLVFQNLKGIQAIADGEELRIATDKVGAYVTVGDSQSIISLLGHTFTDHLVTFVRASLMSRAPLRFHNSFGSNYIALRAPAVLSGSTVFDLPVADGLPGQTILTNGAGGLYFAHANLPPTIQRFTSGSGTYYLSKVFYVASANATAGATYTNNSVTFTVKETISGGAILWCTGNGDPTTSGTLTKASGTGDSTIDFTAYRKPTQIICEVLGAGGGGSGSGSASHGNGGAGGTTTFGTSLLTAGGGGGGGPYQGGSGGTGSVNAPAIIVISIDGGIGGAFQTRPAGPDVPSGFGANSFFGGSGGSVVGAINGHGAVSNSGSGGAGGGILGSTINGYVGAGGGSGKYIKALINYPSHAYSYSIGSGGVSGTAGTNGYTGGPGGSGIIIVQEVY